MCGLKSLCKWSALDLTMDIMPSRCMSFALQAEETTTDDEILIDNHQLSTSGRETDRSEIVAGMEVGAF